MSKPLPDFETDAQAEQFVDTADLSKYDLSTLTTTHFEFAPKQAQLNMRLSPDLFAALKERAAREGVPYTRFVRHALQSALGMPMGPLRLATDGKHGRLRKRGSAPAD